MANSGVRIKQEYADLKPMFKSEARERNMSSIPAAPQAARPVGSSAATNGNTVDAKTFNLSSPIIKSEKKLARRGHGHSVVIRQEKGNIRAHYNRGGQRVDLTFQGSIHFNKKWAFRILDRLSEVHIDLELLDGELELAMNRVRSIVSPHINIAHMHVDSSIFLSDARGLKTSIKVRQCSSPKTAQSELKPFAKKKEDNVQINPMRLESSNDKKGFNFEHQKVRTIQPKIEPEDNKVAKFHSTLVLDPTK